jgi:hypothetical protein
MTQRERLASLAVAAALFALLLGLMAGWQDPLLDGGLHVQAEAILDGALPYADRGFEYPPLSIPLVIAPGLLSDSAGAYREAFAWEMILFGLAIVAMLALLVKGGRKEVWGALAVFVLGVVFLSGLGPLPDSDIDGTALALARFDLAPAAFVLAACFARMAMRSATWGAMLGVGTAIKAFPLLLVPSFAKGERSPWRAGLGFVIPLLIAGGFVLLSGDEFASAVGYHAGRGLQVESVAATVPLLANLGFGTDAATETSAGAYNLIGGGAEAARIVAICGFIIGWVGLVAAGWRREIPLLSLTTAILALALVFSPVLSPQFLLWVLPVSAAAFGIRAPNLILLVTLLATELMLGYYDGVDTLGTEFTVSLAVRNLLFVAYAASVLFEIFRQQQPLAPATKA